MSTIGPPRDASSRRLVCEMVRNRRGLAAEREEVQEHATRVIQEAKERMPGVEHDSDLEDLITDCALVASYGRADVPREAWGSREISDMPVIEEPGRVTHQLRLLARSLLALQVKRDVIERILRHTALGSMPAARARVIHQLAVTDRPLSTNEVGKRTGLAWKVVARALEDWQEIGFTDCERGPADRDPFEWSLTGEHADLVRRVVGRASPLPKIDKGTLKTPPTLAELAP